MGQRIWWDGELGETEGSENLFIVHNLGEFVYCSFTENEEKRRILHGDGGMEGRRARICILKYKKPFSGLSYASEFLFRCCNTFYHYYNLCIRRKSKKRKISRKVSR